ncbi:hypothetical protein NLX67_11180 [Domibacillus sp. A3M-37]|uniref:hypothetical protein n=1 Tax=Domibacillus sp. A3M-37 TaxID=2962037 RepID=UPI0020B746FE|nr:hypothetical protein [Domibacillus sp. A3M-37]MCP3762950.1 hypothetical protein [Domibacillus sp. A3M-37]
MIHKYEADYVTFVSGKALREVTGLAFVGTSRPAERNEQVARDLDLSLYTPIAFSQAYPLIKAMDAALTELTDEQIKLHEEKVMALLDVFHEAGISLVAESSVQAPGILSIQLRKHLFSRRKYDSNINDGMDNKKRIAAGCALHFRMDQTKTSLSCMRDLFQSVDK